MLDHAQRFKVIVGHLFQHGVGHSVGGAVDKLLGHGGFGHHGRSLSNLIHALLQRDGLGYLHVAHHVKHLGFGLYHVGAFAARVGDGIVNARGGGHMLAQELHADVHQLYRVQGRAPQMRRA